MDTDLLINGKASKARFKRDLLFGKANSLFGGRLLRRHPEKHRDDEVRLLAMTSAHDFNNTLYRTVRVVTQGGFCYTIKHRLFGVPVSGVHRKRRQ